MKKSMFDLAKLPERIERKISGLWWVYDDAGMSGSTILLFDKMALKIEKISRSSQNERKLLEWLEGKLPVPKIIEAETRDDHSFLLMERLPGQMACSDDASRNMDDTVRALARGLKMLWQTDVTGCPCSTYVSEKLIQAKYNIEHGLVDTDNFNPETFGSEGFTDIPGLYKFLVRNRPEEDYVFSHGDYTRQNVFVRGGDITGFLDWGNGGVADRWQDIALCVHSLKPSRKYARHGEAEYRKYKRLLFQELAIEPDEEKIRYYTLLDEFF